MHADLLTRQGHLDKNRDIFDVIGSMRVFSCYNTSHNVCCEKCF